VRGHPEIARRHLLREGSGNESQGGQGKDGESSASWQGGDGASGDGLREIVAKVVRELMAEEMEALVGARGYERSEGRLRRHNGTRRRDCDTRVRTI